MLTYIIRRILISIPLLWSVLTLTFFGFRYLVPGDPVDIMLFGRATAADKADLGLRQVSSRTEPQTGEYKLRRPAAQS